MAGTAAVSASAAAMARYERRLRTMTAAVLLADNRRAALGLVASRACQAVGAEVGAVLIRDVDGDDVVVSAARRRSTVYLSPLSPTSALAAQLLGHPPTKPQLIEVPGGRLGPAMAARLVSSRHIRGVLFVARRCNSRPFTEADLQSLGPYAAEAGLAITFAAARRELERGVLAKDRNRIARDLHDGAIQSLYGIGLVIEGIRGEAVRPSVKDQLSGLTESINLVIDDLRSYINDLTPQRLAKRGLGPELCSLAKEFQASSGVTATVRLNGAIDEIGAEVGRDLIQIAREALSNVAKHAAATNVTLSLRRGAHTIRLEVSDDGRGMGHEHTRGRGLPNILRRAQACGGTLEIGPLHGDGTAIRVSVPARAGEGRYGSKVDGLAGRTAAFAIAVGSAGLAITG